jgi:hypothetical protein
MMPCVCAASRASAICAATSTAWAKGNGHGATCQALRERLAREVLHHQVRRVVVRANVVERADVRVCERGDRARLTLEAHATLGIGAERGRQGLGRDRATEAGVAGLADLAHAARPNGGLDLIRAGTGTGGQGHGCRRDCSTAR